MFNMFLNNRGRTQGQHSYRRPKPPPQPVARIYLIRHGETNENREGIIQGQMDTELNEIGCEQAYLCGQALKDIPFTIGFTSDLKRASKTAEIILAQQPFSVSLINDAGLREREMGALQGVKAGSYDRTKIYEGSESGEVFSQRTLAWWEATIMRILASRRTDAPMHILAVSHGAYLSALIRALLTRSIIVRPPGMRLDERYYNTSITAIDMFATGRGILVRHCDINHLLVPEPSAPSGTMVPESAENADAEVLQDR